LCRALLYLGEPVLLSHLLHEPDNSLIKQAYMPKMLHMLNLAGFGMKAWDLASYEPEVPFSYASTSLPIFDRNLKALSEKIRISCLLAHVRGVAYHTDVEITLPNTHPFCYTGFRLAFAHNGDLYRLNEMRNDLLAHISPQIAGLIRGTTDSELIYALLLSQLHNPRGFIYADEMKSAVEQTLRIIREVRARHDIDTSSSVNLFITDGERLAGVRFCFDFGCYRTTGPASVHEANLQYLSLWYTSGREFGCHDGEWKMVGGSDVASSIIVASEPLTRDTSRWLQVPEYGMLYADTRSGHPHVEIHYLDA